MLKNRTMRPHARAGLASALLVAFGLAVPAVARAEPACRPAADEPAITVRVKPTRSPPVDRSLNVVQLTYRARELGNAHARRGRVLGLTESQFRFGVPRLRVEGGPGPCLRPAEIVVELEAVQRVWVVRSSSPNPCWDEAILEHELEHVRFNNEAIARAAALLEPQLAAIGAGAIPGHDAQGAARAFADRVQAAVKAVTREALAEAARRHASIDTPQAYNAVRKRCGV
jgi:hypothetical protein